MPHKLTSERREAIRETLKNADAKAMHYWTYEDENVTIGELLAELDRTRPAWVRTDAGQHPYDRTLHVAGTTPGNPVSVWLGRGRFDSDWGRWVDANTQRPFPAGTEITHWLRELTPAEFIGQPEG